MESSLSFCTIQKELSASWISEVEKFQHAAALKMMELNQRESNVTKREIAVEKRESASGIMRNLLAARRKRLTAAQKKLEETRSNAISEARTPPPEPVFNTASEMLEFLFTNRILFSFESSKRIIWRESVWLCPDPLSDFKIFIPFASKKHVMKVAFFSDESFMKKEYPLAVKISPVLTDEGLKFVIAKLFTKKILETPDKTTFVAKPRSFEDVEKMV